MTKQSLVINSHPHKWIFLRLRFVREPPFWCHPFGVQRFMFGILYVDWRHWFLRHVTASTTTLSSLAPPSSYCKRRDKLVPELVLVHIISHRARGINIPVLGCQVALKRRQPSPARCHSGLVTDIIPSHSALKHQCGQIAHHFVNTEVMPGPSDTST